MEVTVVFGCHFLLQFEDYASIDDNVLLAGNFDSNPNKLASLVLSYIMHTIVITDNDLLLITCRGHDFL